MENKITRLSERLKSEPAWATAIANLDEKLNQMSVGNAAQITSYFAHEANLTARVNDMAWLSLLLQTSYFFRELDSSGVSEIIGRVAPEYLGGFSYQSANEFRSVEESLVPELEIPESAWELVWDRVDQNKNEFMSQMGEYRPYSFYRHLFSSIEELSNNPPISFRPLSPFRWSKGVAVGIGTVIGISDTLGGVLTLPFGWGIAAASIVGAGVLIGYDAGAE